ncbi:MAG: DegV family protein [Dehalococcoidia bacterium]
MAVQVVTDSTADLPPEEVRRWGIIVVPLNIHFDTEVYRDGLDITPDAFYQRLVSSPRLPTTSQPSAGDFLEVYQRLLAEGYEVVSIHISSKLSGTLNSALAARQQIGPDCPVEIMDALQASVGLGLAALAAARAVQAGASRKETVEEVNRALPYIHFFGLLDTLEYLQKGGRIGKAQAFLGALLKIKPLLAIRDGEVHPLERVRTREKALARMVAVVRELAPVQELAVCYTTAPQEAEELRQRLSDLLPAEQILMSRIGPVVGTHCGPGAVGVGVRSARAG